MNAKVVSKEKNTVKFTFEVGPEKLEEGMVYAYKMCIRDSSKAYFRIGYIGFEQTWTDKLTDNAPPVSYTHLLSSN